LTPQIATVLGIMALAMILFVTERLRMDLVALLVLVALALTGLVTPAEALSGFSSAAVITVGAVFVLSGGLSRTGVANVVGRQIMRLAGRSELRLVIVIMLSAAVMSAFMNNIGVAALLLPVVINIARHTDRPPSKLLMPLAFGCLLGGLVTLIGTPPNIIVSDTLREYGLRPFQLFDYTPVGLAVMLAGVAFMALVGRHLLPTRDPARESSAPEQVDLRQFYDLQERLFIIHLPPGSALDGKTLGTSRLGAALGLNVIAIIRNSQTQLAPEPGAILRSGDRLLVQGRMDRLAELNGKRQIVVEDDSQALQKLVSTDIGVAEGLLSSHSSLLGQTLRQTNFRHRFGVNVLAIYRGGVPRRTNLQGLPLQPGDTLLVQGPLARLEEMQDAPEFDSFRPVSDAEVGKVYRVHERLIVLRVPEGSILAGNTLADSRLGDAFGLTVLGITRGGKTHLMPDSEESLQAGDALLVEGKPEDLLTLRGLQGLEMDGQASLDLRDLESEHVGLAEVVLSPHTTLIGKTLYGIHFREKYGLSVLAIWREGRAYRSNLRDMALRFGDAFLVYGPRERLRVLRAEPDFLVLTEVVEEAPRLKKAFLALIVMAGVLLPVVLGWLPISVTAVAGAALMVLVGCLTMEEAYRSIEWPAVFLIAGMSPLAIAMEQTGTAALLADGIVTLTGGLGPMAVVAGVFILTTLISQVMTNTGAALLLIPIALNTAHSLGISPYALAMTVAISASACFLSPVSHPANVLVMGPGGYRFSDYVKVGLPLTLVVLVVTLLVLPIFWPLFP